MRTFEIGMIYVARHRLNNYFFEVVWRTAKTLAVNLRGSQENVSVDVLYQITQHERGFQKARVYVDKNSNSEYVYVGVDYILWTQPTHARVIVMASDVTRP